MQTNAFFNGSESFSRRELSIVRFVRFLTLFWPLAWHQMSAMAIQTLLSVLAHVDLAKKQKEEKGLLNFELAKSYAIA